MEERTQPHGAAAAAPGENRADLATATASLEDAPDLRLQRILDHLHEALAAESPLAANLGAVNSDLMLMGYRLQQVIEAAMAATPVGLDQFELLMPAISNYLRIIKQIDRLAQLSLRLAAAQEEDQATRQRLQ
jgi:hypothetical protein